MLSFIYVAFFNFVSGIFCCIEVLILIQLLSLFLFVSCLVYHEIFHTQSLKHSLYFLQNQLKIIVYMQVFSPAGIYFCVWHGIKTDVYFFTVWIVCYPDTNYEYLLLFLRKCPHFHIPNSHKNQSLFQDFVLFHQSLCLTLSSTTILITNTL